MTEKYYIDSEDLKNYCNDLVRKIYLSGFVPDTIIAPSRGGLIPGVFLSHYFNVPFQPVELSTRDFQNNVFDIQVNVHENILVVDDICDSGSTLKILNKELEKLDPKQVKYAVLHHNIDQDEFEVNFAAEELNKNQDPVWVIYPWEEWWRMEL